MPKKKCNCPPAGAPEWMVTYGDMMTLLLCFFVLIVSFSEIKKEDQYEAAVEEIKKAFGLKGGGGPLPTHQDPAMSLMNILETQRLRQETVPAKSNAQDPGIDGKEAKVTAVRKGHVYTVGGRILFEPGSAVLTAQGKDQLRRAGDRIKGYNTLIEVRGHTAPNEPLAGDPRAGAKPAIAGVAGFAGGASGGGASGEDEFDGPLGSLSPARPPARAHNLWELSYERAKAVFDFLTSDEVGLDPNRFRLVGNADREPVVQRAYDAQSAAPNRRVEVEVTDKLVKDFTQPER